MTEKIEAQPEALELADRLIGNADIDECEGCNPVVVGLERSAATELRRQHAEIQQLKAEKAEMARMHFENYEFQRAKADNATATVYQFHYAMKDAGWHPGRTDDDLTEIIRAKGRELAQLSARQAAQDGWRLVPVEVVNLYDFMCLAFVPMTGQHEQIAISLKLAKAAMLSAAPHPPSREPQKGDQ